MHALPYATAKHQGQKRKTGEDYITHPLAVMAKVKAINLGPKMEKVALLHDICEDCAVSRAELSKQFGEEISWLVHSLSKEPKDKYPRSKKGQNQRLQDYLLRLEEGMSKEPKLVLVKMADQLDNLSTLEVFKIKKYRRILREIRAEYLPLYKRISQQMSPNLIKKYEILKKELELKLKVKEKRQNVRWWWKKTEAKMSRIKNYLF